MNNESFRAEFNRSEALARQQSKKIADTIGSEMHRVEVSTQRAGAGFGNALKSSIAFGAGVAGVTVGLGALHQGLTGVISSTTRLQQSQFALARTYGETAPQIIAATKQIADITGKSTAESQAAGVAVATLAKNYGATAEEQKILLKRTADLAAVHGLTLVDAAKRSESAMRGETEASELLSVSLASDLVRATAAMTKEQRKNWETLDQVTKRQIIFKEFLRQTATAEGAAAEQSTTLQGALDKAGGSAENFGAAMGASAAGPLTAFITQVGKGIDRLTELKTALDAQAKRDLAAQRHKLGTFTDVPTPSLETIGPLQAPVERADERARIIGELQQRGDARIKILEKEADRRTKLIDKEIEEGERLQRNQLKRIDEAEKAELKSLATTHQARLDANKADIDGAERAKDRAIRAAEDRHDAAVKLIEDEAQALQRARELEDRGLQDSRSGADRDISDRRAEVDRTFDAERDAAIESLRDQEEARKRTVASEIRLIEDRTTAALRGLDAEAEAARDTADASLRGIEDEQRAEYDRHRSRMQNLADEEARALGRIDRRLEALDKVERKEAEAERDTRLQTTLTAAQRRLVGVRRTGNPAAIAAAERALADAQAAIEKESTQRRRDATRRRLQDQADEIRKDFAAKQRALEAEDRARKAAADEEKRRIRDTLDAALEAIAARKQEVQDGAKAEIETIKTNDQAAQDAYNATVQRLQTEFELREQARATERLAQDRALADGRLAEDRALSDRRQAEDLDLAARREASDLALKAERDAVDLTYNGEQGILTLLRKATEDINREHQLQTDEAKRKYEEQRKAAVEIFENDAKTGYLDQLRAHKEDIKLELDKQVEDWGLWKGGTIKEIDEVIKKIDDLIKRIGSIPGAEGTPPVQVDGGDQALPNGPVSGGSLAYGPVVRNASADSYWTSGGTHGGHPAADIFAPSGSPVYAPVDGTLDSYNVSQGGNAATMTGADGRSYYFAHGKVPFASGPVKRGQIIGQVGNSGNAQFTASHLHFAISSSGPGIFDQRNGSGNVMGDASYWGDGGIAGDTGEGDWIDVELFGRKYRILVGNSTVGGEIGNAIRRALAAAGKPADWEMPMGQIAAAESGKRNSDGSVVLGSGNPNARNPVAVGNLGHASGLMQMLPPTFQSNRVGSLPDNIFDIVANPASAGNYIDRRYGSPWGTPYFKTGRMDTRGVQGYATGGPISEPTLLYGLQSQRVYAMAGEAGPEDVVPRGQSGDAINIHVHQRAGEDGYTFARRVVAVLDERQEEQRRRG